MKTPKPEAAARPVKVSFALLALLLAVAIAPRSALAHAQIATSTPPNGATVAPGLTRIILNFTEDVSPEQSSARLVGQGGTAVAGVASAVDRASRTRMTVITPPLQAGNYTIKWLAVTENDNGHTSGTINFAVAASDSAASSLSSSTTGANSSLPATGADGTWLVLLGVLAGALLLLVLVVALRLKGARPAKPPTGTDAS